MDRERFHFQSQDYSQFLSSWSFCCHLGSYNFSVRAYGYSWNCVLVHGDSHHEQLIAEPVWHHRISTVTLRSLRPHQQFKKKSFQQVFKCFFVVAPPLPPPPPPPSSYSIHRSTLLPFHYPLLPLCLPTLLAPTLSELTHNVGTVQFRLDSVCSLTQANKNDVCMYLLFASYFV